MNLGKVVSDRYNQPYLDELMSRIDEATWPWRLWRPVLTREYDVVDCIDYVLIEARFGKNLDQIYFHKMPMPYTVDLGEALMIITESFKHTFRSWRTEPANNIVLGEN